MSARTNLALLAITSVIAALAGCGSGGGTGGSGGTTTQSTTGSGAAGGTSSVSTTSSGSGGATSSTTATGSGGSGGAPAPCTDFVVTPSVSPPVTIRLTNKTTGNLYLGQPQVTCSIDAGFALEDASGNAFKPARDLCDFTCEEMQQGGCACPPNCPTPMVRLLAPGAYFEIGWPRTVFESAKMPASCYSESGCAGTNCYMEKDPPASLTIKASGWTQDVCPSGPCTECNPGTSGTCLVQGAQTVAGTEHKGSATWTGENSVAIDLL